MVILLLSDQLPEVHYLLTATERSFLGILKKTICQIK